MVLKHALQSHRRNLQGLLVRRHHQPDHLQLKLNIQRYNIQVFVYGEVIRYKKSLLLWINKNLIKLYNTYCIISDRKLLGQDYFLNPIYCLDHKFYDQYDSVNYWYLSLYIASDPLKYNTRYITHFNNIIRMNKNINLFIASNK